MLMTPWAASTPLGRRLSLAYACCNLNQVFTSLPCSFPGNVLHLLMDFLGDTNTAAALDVVYFVREVMETNEGLRPTVLAQLLESFADIRSTRVCTCGLWIAGEYSVSQSDIEAALKVRS